MNLYTFSMQRNRISRRFKEGAQRMKAMEHLAREAGATARYSGKNLIGWILKSGAVVCKKRRYKTREIAEDCLVDIQRMPLFGQAPTRIYKCPSCKGWHLSSEDR